MDKSFNYLISPEILKLRDFSPKLKIAILASGEGSNFQKLIDLSQKNNFDIYIRLLITNKSEAGCLSKAKKSIISYKIIKVSDYENKEYFEEEIINTILKHDIELVVMAGWMKIMSSKFVNSFKNKGYSVCSLSCLEKNLIFNDIFEQEIKNFQSKSYITKRPGTGKKNTSKFNLNLFRGYKKNIKIIND